MKMTPMMVLLTVLTFTTLVSAQNRSPLNWQLWDVSVLLPLPQSSSEIPMLLSPRDLGVGGPLLPSKATDPMPRIVGRMQNADVLRDHMKMIAFRIDPCFQSGHNVSICNRQIRFVWQPVVEKAAKITTLDAAIHSFYELDPGQWQSFLSAYNKIRASHSRSPESALQIHPLMAKEGLSGSYWQQMRELLLKYCGEKNLSRATVMTVEAHEDQWVFTGFDIQGDSVEAMTIPGIGTTGQTFMTTLLEAKEFIASIMPINFPEIGLWFFDNSQVARQQFSEKDFQKWSRDLLKIEDPRQHNPGTVDCISCHTASTVLIWQKENFPKWDWKKLSIDNGYTSSRNLENITDAKARSNHLRAFGYQRNDPRFSQRLINESAAVADHLDQNP